MNDDDLGDLLDETAPFFAAYLLGRRKLDKITLAVDFFIDNNEMVSIFLEKVTWCSVKYDDNQIFGLLTIK